MCLDCKSPKNPGGSKRRKSGKEKRTRLEQDRAKEGKTGGQSTQTPNLRKRRRVYYCEESEEAVESDNDGFEQEPVPANQWSARGETIVV